MINFRYHVISVTAVFVAIATGLVLGTAAWSGPESESLRDQVSSIGQQNQILRDQLAHLNADVNAREAFAEQLAPVVLAGRLLGVKVLILSSPSGKANVDGVIRMLATAGASVTGAMEVTDAFTDPVRDVALLDLANASLPPSVVGGLPAHTDGVRMSSALLSAVLLARAPPVAEPDLRSVLTAYSSQGYLLGADGVTGPADVVVFVPGPPAIDGAAVERNAAVLAMVGVFDTGGSVVVAANADAGAGNVVAQLRSDPQRRLSVSTVDNVATPQGRLVTAWAVADQLVGKTGHYGVGAGATLVPPK